MRAKVIIFTGVIAGAFWGALGSLFAVNDGDWAGGIAVAIILTAVTLGLVALPLAIFGGRTREEAPPPQVTNIQNVFNMRGSIEDTDIEALRPALKEMSIDALEHALRIVEQQSGRGVQTAQAAEKLQSGRELILSEIADRKQLPGATTESLRCDNCNVEVIGNFCTGCGRSKSEISGPRSEAP